jgi:hypothetical protein
MNFVYICRDGENEELRYSIRSIVNNCNIDSIWVVGGKPDWYAGNYIGVTQKYSKYKNAFNNFKTICNASEIPDDFVLMNDDFFIINSVDKITSYYNGTLEEKINAYETVLGRSSYVNRLKITQDKLIQMGFDNPLNYEIHVPMAMSKKNFNDVLGMNHNLLYRSVYGNKFSSNSIEMKDVKVYSSDSFELLSFDYKNIQSPFLSTESGSFLELKNLFLSKHFSQKTIYEV